MVLLGFHPKSEVVVFLELGDSLKSLFLYEFADGSAVGQLENVCLEVVVSESEVEKLLGVLSHFLQFGINQDLEILAEVAEDQTFPIHSHLHVILHLVALVLFKQSHTQPLPLLCHSIILITKKVLINFINKHRDQSFQSFFLGK